MVKGEHFVLDQCFPLTIPSLREPGGRGLPSGDILRHLLPVNILSDVLPGGGALPDHELLLSLEDIPGVRGLITTDSNFLEEPPNAVALLCTSLTLVIVEGGHDPLQALGLVIASSRFLLSKINESDRGRSAVHQIHRYKGNAVPDIYKKINTLAMRRNKTPDQLIDELTAEWGIPSPKRRVERSR